MDDNINQILSALVINVMDHFGFEADNAIAAVALSKVADDLTTRGNEENHTIDELSQMLYKEISLAK